MSDTDRGNAPLVFAAVVPLIDQAVSILADLSVACDSIGLDHIGSGEVRRFIATALNALSKAQDRAGDLR